MNNEGPNPTILYLFSTILMNGRNTPGSLTVNPMELEKERKEEKWLHSTSQSSKFQSNRCSMGVITIARASVTPYARDMGDKLQKILHRIQNQHTNRRGESGRKLFRTGEAGESRRRGEWETVYIWNVTKKFIILYLKNSFYKWYKIQ